MKIINDFNFRGKIVLVRCDFNVPISSDGKRILDSFRIKEAMPTIKKLAKKGAKVVLMSHLEKKGKTFSLKPVAKKLSGFLDKEVDLMIDYLKEGARGKIEKMNPGQVVLLENLRFYKEEKENDRGFAKKLAKLGDVYVNEAFSASHRGHASIVSVPKYLPSAIGPLFERELEIFSKICKDPAHPFVVIIGGIKIHTKVDFILGILKQANYVLFASKTTESILVHRHVLKGRRLTEEEQVSEINIESDKIRTSIDAVIMSDDGKIRTGKIEGLKKNEDVYDIGPQTIESFKRIIKTAKTILINGPLGMYEDKRFSKGTKEILNAVAKNKSAFKIIGGGDTILAVQKFKFDKKFDFLSTGGGAMLKYLADQKLPGLEAIKHGN